MLQHAEEPGREVVTLSLCVPEQTFALSLSLLVLLQGLCPGLKLIQLG